MSQRDGRLKRKDLYLTSDASFAAYLMLRGYDLLGAIDEGDTQANGRPRMYFGLTPTEDRLLRLTLSTIEADINGKYDEFENMWLEIPHDKPNKINVRQFHLNTRACFRALDEAIKK